LPHVADEEIVDLSVKSLIKTLARKLKRSYDDIRPAVKRAIKDWREGVFDDGGDDAAVASPDAAGNNICWGSELYDAGAGASSYFRWTEDVVS
jgi:hypothetical protein